MGWPDSFFKIAESPDALSPRCPNDAYGPEWSGDRSFA
jgi:hypothetical protein